MAVELWERAARYIKEVMEMDDNRWPKKCLKIEIRGIINGDPSKWGKELKQVMEGVREGAIWNIIRNGDQEELERRVHRVVQIKTDQKIQGDWNKIEKSEFWKDYRYLKGNMGMEKYWEDRKIKGELKETWARMRCGSVGREWKHGYKNEKCRMCDRENETLEHICECEEAKNEIKMELVEEMEEWRNGEAGDKVRKTLINCLREKPILVLCSYVTEFVRIARKRERGEAGEI